MVNRGSGYARRYSVPMRALCLLLSVLLLLPAGGAAAGLVAPVQAVSAGVARAAGSSLSAVAHVISALFASRSPRPIRWPSLLAGIPQLLGAGDEEAPHDLAEVYWNVAPTDVVDSNTNDVLLYGGNDENSGADDAHPVLTFDRAMALAAPGAKLWVMTEYPALEDTLLSGDVEGTATVLDFYVGSRPNTSLLTSAEGANLTLQALSMTDLTAAQDPNDNKRLVNLNTGTLTLDAGVSMHGDLFIERFADETANSPSPEITVTQALAASFAANMDLTVNFLCDQHTCYTVSGGKTEFDFLVFPEGFDASTVLGCVHLDSSLTTNFGDLNLIWKVRVKPGSGNGHIVQIYLAEPYDGAIYLSGDGDDANRGLYPDEPVETFARAVAILMGTAPDSQGPDGIDAYRQEHGDFQPKQGVIRITGSPVQIHANIVTPAYVETWTMPADSWWTDDGGNVVSPSWVERHKTYQGDLIAVEPLGRLNLTDITISGNYAKQPGAVGSILTVGLGAHASIGTGALLTQNHAEIGGGVRLSGVAGAVSLDGGAITQCYATDGNQTGKGGGVFINAGTFYLYSGTITQCSANRGGGIYVGDIELDGEGHEIASAAKLLGGSVTNNSANEGGGVFTRQDFKVLATTATDAEVQAAGANVCRIPVTNNVAAQYGGGWLAEDCAFVLDGGEITGNRVTLNMINHAGGGGIAARRSFFKMINGASVHDNTVLAQSVKGTPSMVGGGVYCANAPEAVRDENSNEIVKYPVEIAVGCEIYNNVIDVGATSGYTLNIYGGGIAVGGGDSGVQANKIVKLDGRIHDNQLKGYYSGSQNGAGVFVSKAPTYLSATCRIDNNVVDGQGTASGVGIRVTDAGLWLNGCEIDHNVHKLTRGYSYSYTYATNGGGVAHNNGAFYLNAPNIHNNTLNTAVGSGSHYGGGVYLNQSVCAMEPGTRINENTGFTQGGGVYVTGANSVFASVAPSMVSLYAEIAGNTVTSNNYGGGAGVYVYEAAQVNLNYVRFTDNVAGFAGGFYAARTPSISMYRCIFTNNRATGTSDSYGARGGAVCIDNRYQSANYAVQLSQCEFYKNTAAQRGGAVSIDGSNGGYYYAPSSSNFRYYRTTINDCTFGDGTAANANTCTNGDANGRGGALYYAAGELTVTGGTRFEGNAADQGGAIYAYHENYVQTLRIEAAALDAAFRRNSAADGGAIFTNNVPVILTGEEHRVVFEENMAARGAAIYTHGGQVTMDHTDFIHNAMTWLPEDPVTGVEARWVPALCDGPAVYSRQAFVYCNASNCTVQTFYFYHRDYFLRLTGAPSADFGVQLIALNVREGSYYRSGDHVVEPASPLTTVAPYEANYTLTGEAADAYDLIVVGVNLVLAPRSVYIDGVDGDDANSGSKPNEAVRTFAVARQKLVTLLNANPEAEKTIYIVNTVTVNDSQVWTFDGDTMPVVDDEGAPTGETVAVYGVKLLAYIADNRLNVGGKALVLVDGGDLTVEGITLDGNRSAFAAKAANYGYKVVNNGSLTLTELAVVQNHRAGIYAQGNANNNAADRPSVTLETVAVKNCNNADNVTYTTGSDPYRDTSAAGVTVKYGALVIDEAEISGCTGFRQGGGVHVEDATATLTDVMITHCNTTSNTGYFRHDGDMFVIYNTHGGCGIHAENSTLTMTGCNVDENATSGVQACGGAMKFIGGSLQATGSSFNRNGQSNGWNGGYGGIVAITGNAAATFENCQFNSNRSLEAPLYLFPQTTNGANVTPEVWLKGCIISSNTTAYGTGVTAIGSVNSTPKVHISASTGENGRQSSINWNSSTYPFGAVFGSRAEISISDTLIYNNSATAGRWSTIMSTEEPGGGAAIHLRFGRLSVTASSIYNNTTGEGGFGNNQYFCGGTINLYACTDAEIRGCEISNNTFKVRDGMSSSYMAGERYRGGGLSLTNVTQALIEDVVVENNKIQTGSFNADGRNDLCAYGAGIGVKGGGRVTLRDVALTGNTISAKNGSKTHRRGAGLYAESAQIELNNVTASANTGGEPGALWFQSCSFIGVRTALEVAGGDIVLAGNNTPISLLSPLSGAGELPLRFSEAFMGKHIVCGYLNGDVDLGYHNTTADLGELNAYDYLAETASPRFIAAEKPAAQHLSLLPGNGYPAYVHDIIVGNLRDVFLDGVNGVDALRDTEGHITGYQTDDGGVVHDGSSPEKAFKTFDCAKEALKGSLGGGDIILCGKVTVSRDEDWSLGDVTNGFGVTWQPTLKRYMNPDKAADAASRYTGEMVEVVSGACLTITDLTVNGNCRQNEYPRICGSMIRVNGGELYLGSGSVLRGNHADRGGAVYMNGGTAAMGGNAKITDCVIDANSPSYYGGEAHCYGGGVYIAGGEFFMSSAESEITACGPIYSFNSDQHCYGALVYVANGSFRQVRGRLTDARAFKAINEAYATGSRYFYGAVCVNGAKYTVNEETGVASGALAEIGDVVTGNCLKTSSPAGDDTQSFPFSIYASAFASLGGTVRLNPALIAILPIHGEHLQILSNGASITNNRIQGTTYGYVYLYGANALLDARGGELVDGFTSSHTYCVFLTNSAQINMTGGVWRFAYCSYPIYINQSCRFEMNGGEIVRTYSSGSGGTICTGSGGVFVMNDGEIHCAENVLPDVTALTNYGYATINGGSIYRFGSDCILTSSQSLTINGGSISASRYSGVRQDSGSFTMNGGEIFGNARGLVMNGGTATFNKADIHHNTASGLKVQGSSATLRITSDDVVIRENSCYENTIFVTSGTLNMTGGDVHDNRSGNGTIRVDSGANNASISSVMIYNNYCSVNGGGIYFYLGSYNRNHSVSGCDIHDNSAGDGAGVYIYTSTSGNYTGTVDLSYNEIHHNTARAKGGAAAIYAETTGQYQMDIRMNGNDLHDNTATGNGGGVYVKLGQDTTTANPARLTFGLTAYGTTISNNVSSGNGGGVFIERAKRNNVRASFVFRMEEKAQVINRISGNRAANGGGLYFINNMTNATFPVINAGDVQFLFSDASVNSNIATGDGGGIMTPGGAYGKQGMATFYFNNAELLGNAAQRGGGFFADGGAIFQVSQGMIAKNEANQGAGGFVNKADLRFANNYTFIEETDHIYLNDRGYPITAWQSFTNTESVYNVYPSEAFVAGDIVVRPGTEAGGFCPDASPFLRNFYSVRPGTVIDRLAPYLILGRIVFLDGETGVDPVINGTTFVYQTDGDGIVHDGTAPDKAFKTFKASKAVLGDAPGAIYVSGPVHYRQDDLAEDDVWTLGEKQYLRRYCGFRVSSDQAYPGFAGDMFLVEQGTLTLEDLPVEGSYKADETWTAAGSVFAVCGADAKLILQDGASIKDNVTTGDGAAIRIEQGEAVLQAGEISGNATTGRGVVYQGDTLTVSGSALTLEGEIYLAAGDEAESIPDRVITVVETPDVPALDFAPVNGYLSVGMENPYDGRDIVAYPAAEIPLEAQKAIYALAPEISSLYVVDNDPVAANVLELRLPYQVYLDGVAGDDALDGSTPAKAVRTLQRAYELVSAAFVDPEIITSGGLVHVVDTVTVTDAVSLSSSYVSGGVTVDAGGPVTFKRYAQPTAYESIPGGGFEKPTNRNEIFIVADHGDLHLAGVTVDGHSLAVPEGSGPKLAAPGVTAQAAPVLVEDGGVFEMSAGRLQSSRVEAETPAIPGGAIHVSDGAIASVTGGVITDTLDQNGVSIYDGGELAFSGSPSIKGSVYLEQPETRVSVPAVFTPAQPVSVLPANTFNGRDIAVYDAALGIPGSAEKASWKLPDDVLLNYVLNNNAEDPQILELQLRACVYVDGVDGLDTNSGADPEHSVRTLKRAYEILSGLEGSTIYIVNEVTLASSATLDHGMYLSGMDSIDAGSDVQILRYAQPTAYDPDEDDHGELNGFGVESYVSGPLITVPAGVSLILSGVTVDGHSEAITAGEPQYVSPGLVTAAALVRVNEGATLRATGGTMLQNNNNTLPAPAGEGKGGAVENNGRLLLDAVVLRENNATHGAGVYQNGTLELSGAAGPVIGEDQWIYLTGMKAQTPEQKPAEHKINVTGLLDDTLKVTVDLEWPEIGRDVAQFSATAFLETVENEREHFALAPGLEYIIVKSPEADEPDTLELGEIPAFTLEYDGNGGTLPDGVTTRVPDPDMPYNDLLGYNAYDKGTIIEVKENNFAFQQAGETFVAWNTQPDGTGKTFLPGDSFWDETTGIFESTVLYAVWEDLDREYTVTYKPNNLTEEADVVDGPYGQLDTVTVKYNAGDGGTHFTPPDGRQFIGWNTQPDESGLWYFPPGAVLPGFIPTVTNEDGEFLIAGDIELYAIWRVTSPHSLTIFKYADLRDLKEPNKTFLFEIEDIYPLSENYGKKYYVYLGTCIDGATGETVPAWIDNAYCYATVTGLAEGKYRVRELTEWSWRYTISDAYGADTVNYTVSAGHEIVVSLTDHRTVSFVNELTDPYYVNGYARSYSNTFIQP